MRVRNHRRLVSSGAPLMPDSGQLAERELRGAPERKRTVPLPGGWPESPLDGNDVAAPTGDHHGAFGVGGLDRNPFLTAAPELPCQLGRQDQSEGLAGRGRACARTSTNRPEIEPTVRAPLATSSRFVTPPTIRTADK